MTAIPPISADTIAEAGRLYVEHSSIRAVAKAMGVAYGTAHKYIHRAAEQGKLGTEPVLPGFRISQTTAVYRDGALRAEFVQQKPEKGEPFGLPAGQAIKGVSALVDADGREIIKWIKTAADPGQQAEAFAAVIEALKEDLPRVAPIAPPASVNGDLLNQFTVTDSHFGMLAHREETGADYDLKLAEQLLLDWFSAAIAGAPDAHTAVLAQLGDLMHHDALESVTPAHKHVLDADSRLHKVVRVVIRTLRRVIDMLLEKHQNVHVVMASGNHDPASSVWIRELLATIYEDEPRITVDTSPKLYYAYAWGSTALFYHHGHKRNVGNVDATLAGMFREQFGLSQYAYAHIGHLHSDEGRKSALMYVERHETLAAPDAYAAGGGWLSGRSAKVITYSRRYGEVARATLRPEMVRGYRAANDNVPAEQRRVA